MTDGSVYEDNDDFKTIVDEKALAGIFIDKNEKGEEMRRTRQSWRVYSRLFDGSDWLGEEEETVFDYIPLVPLYGNFDIVDDNVVYFGKLENLYDPQRVLNYALSRDIEDGALSPSPTIWMTDSMAEGNDYSDMNTSRDPVRIFNIDDQNPGLTPQYTGGPQQSQGLQTTIQNAMQMINTSSNTFNAQQGNANAQQSGIAGLQQIEQGNVGNIKWFKDIEVAWTQVGKILINAIPRVYDATRQVRILDEDGSYDIVTLNEIVFDQQTGKNISLNDLSIGEYDVVCEVGPAFNSAQKEAARSIEAMLAASPEISPMVLDVLFSNKKEPGMDIIAERLREQAFNNKLIPEDQWTDEERQKVAEQQALAAQQPPQEDPMMVAARAEEAKAQADMAAAQIKQMEVQGKQQVDMARIQLEQQKLQLDAAKFERDKSDKYNVDLINADQNQQKIDLQAQKQVQELALKLTELEQKIGQQLNSEFQSNVLVFNPQTGEFE
jgi:hypothetical protein